MTRDDIIRMAKEVGIEFHEYTDVCGRKNITSNGSKRIEVFERFAELVSAAEREECAKVCDEQSEIYAALAQTDGDEIAMRISDCAALIRARGDA